MRLDRGDLGSIQSKIILLQAGRRAARLPPFAAEVAEEGAEDAEMLSPPRTPRNLRDLRG